MPNRNYRKKLAAFAKAVGISKQDLQIAKANPKLDNHAKGRDLAFFEAALGVGIMLFLLQRISSVTAHVTGLLLACMLLLLIHPTVTLTCYLRKSSPARCKGSITIAMVLLVAGMSWFATSVWPQPPLITIKLVQSSLPIWIAPHSIAYVLPMSPYIGIPDTKDWTIKIPNETGEEGFWPSQKEVDSNGTKNLEKTVHVEISNHSQRVLEEGKVAFGLKYATGKLYGCDRPEDSKPDQEDVVLLPALNPGASYELYVVNQSQYCAWLIPPQYLAVRMGGEKTEIDIPATYDKNPLYDAGAPIFPPTFIKWETAPTTPGPHYGIIQDRPYFKGKQGDSEPKPNRP